MKRSAQWKRYLPHLAGAVLVLGIGAFFLIPRNGGPGLAERLVEHYGAADNDAARGRDPDKNNDAAARPSEVNRPKRAKTPTLPGDKDAAAGDKNQGEPGVVKFTPEGLQLAGIRIETAGYRTVRSRLALTGTVEPNLTGVVKVTPRVAGKITSVRVNVGSRVGAGQALATLTSTELAQAQASYRQAVSRVAVAQDNLQRQEKLARLGAFGSPSLEAARNQAATAQADARTAQSGVAAARARRDQAQSQLQVLRTALEQAQTQAVVTQSRFNRADLLLKAGVASGQDWEQSRADNQKAQADVDVARAKIAQGRAGIETAQANLAAAQANLAAAQERAQIAAQALAREQAVYRGGYATSQQLVAAQATLRPAQLDRAAAADSVRLLGGSPGGANLLAITAPLSGDVTERAVTLGESVTPDQGLFTIMDLRTVWVQLNAYPGDVPAIRVGQPVTIASDTAPGRTFEGSVSFISDLMGPTTHTVPVRCVIRNFDDRLKPGTFVRGTIAAGPRARALVVPIDATQQLSGQTVVFVPGDKAGEFLARSVEVGPKFGQWIEIRGGLKVGDRVVTRNAFLVKSQVMKGQLGDEDQDKGDKG